MPHVRQTVSTFCIAEAPPATAILPTDGLGGWFQPDWWAWLYLDRDFYSHRVDPLWLATGNAQCTAATPSQPASPYRFDVLRVVDWSPRGDRVALLRETGMLHAGIWQQEVLVFDQTGALAETPSPDDEAAVMLPYPAIREAIHYNGLRKGLPLKPGNWRMQLLGWESNTSLLVEGWYLSTKPATFLGRWRYDLIGNRSSLVSAQPAPVALSLNGQPLAGP